MRASRRCPLALDPTVRGTGLYPLLALWKTAKWFGVGSLKFLILLLYLDVYPVILRHFSPPTIISRL